jgi:hypothetical protein
MADNRYYVNSHETQVRMEKRFAQTRFTNAMRLVCWFGNCQWAASWATARHEDLKKRGRSGLVSKLEWPRGNLLTTVVSATTPAGMAAARVAAATPAAAVGRRGWRFVFRRSRRTIVGRAVARSSRGVVARARRDWRAVIVVGRGGRTVAIMSRL